jgi:sugar phosphate isomerase/epimerase
MGAAVEFVPGTGVPTLAAALALAEATPGLRLVIDLMHVFRSGSTAADLAAIDPALIAHVQICDAPRTNATMSYGVEALHHRLPPGEGELPLAEALAVLPKDVVVSLELPMLSRAEAGEGPRERLAGAVTTTRAMLASV